VFNVLPSILVWILINWGLYLMNLVALLLDLCVASSRTEDRNNRSKRWIDGEGLKCAA